MNKFVENEKKGRELFSDLLLSLGVGEQKMFPSVGLRNPVDYFFIHNDKRYCVEIKVRDKRFAGLKTHFLEVKKKNAMLKAMEDNECQEGIYVNFFGDNLVVIYNLKKTDSYPVIEMKCNRFTAVNAGKIVKDVIECPAEQGVWLIKCKKTGKWVETLDYVKKKL